MTDVKLTVYREERRYDSNIFTSPQGVVTRVCSPVSFVLSGEDGVSLSLSEARQLAAILMAAADALEVAPESA